MLPVFNVEIYLDRVKDSLINQTIGCENLEIIFVDDCSTDSSGEMIDRYAQEYECCKAIHLEENTGGCGEPRNAGMEKCTGDYIMFLDPDDIFMLDTCEKLYNACKENDADIAFGRFRRIYNDGEVVQKSFSPYMDNLDEMYPTETLEDANLLNVPNFIWKHLIKKILFGNDIIKKYNRKEPIDIIKVKKIEEEPDLFKINPSVWTKIYKRELIINNNIQFIKIGAGEDIAFVVDSFLKANGIVFLNNYFCYDYFIRNLPNDKSISNNINVNLQVALLDAYTYCAEISKSHGEEISNVIINPHLMHWFNNWKMGSFTKEENKLLIKKLKNLQFIHNKGFKTKFLIGSMIKIIEISNLFKKNKQ